jgi:hypothetical protein
MGSRSHLLSLPPELISNVIIFLPRKDLLTFSLLSSAARLVVLGPLFRKVNLTLSRGDLQPDCGALSWAGDAIKGTIR